MNPAASVLFSLRVAPRGTARTDLPVPALSTLARAQPTARSACPSASPLRSIGFRRYWNLNQSSIAHGFRPRLRSRLTLGGRTFPRKPWIFGGQDSHLPFATHANILSRARSTRLRKRASAPARRSSTTPFGVPSFGNEFQPRSSSARSHSTSELLRTL